MTPTIEDLIFKHFNGCQWYAPILDTRIKEFATEYAASLNRQGWTRVETELPEIGVTVLVYFLEHIYESKLLEAKKSYLSDYSIGNKFYKWDYFTNGCRAYKVTHWMKLPKPPK